MADRLKSGVPIEKLEALVESGAYEHLSQGGPIKSRGKWRAQFHYTLENDVPNAKGKKPNHTLTVPLNLPCTGDGKVTMTEARKAVQELRIRIKDDCKAASGVNLPTGATVSEAIAEYIQARYDLKKIEASTASAYRDSAKYVDKYIGEERFDQLTSQQVQAWIIKLSKDYSPVTVHKAYRILNETYRYVMKHTPLLNPCDDIDLPKFEDPTQNTVDRAKVSAIKARLIREFEKKPDAIHVAALIIAETGMRPQEVCGLTWANVDLDNQKLHVEHAIGQAKGGDYEKSPKSKNGIRRLKISQELCNVLARWKSLYAKQVVRLKATSPLECQYVIGYPDGTGGKGHQRSPHNLAVNWAKYRKRADSDESGNPLDPSRAFYVGKEGNPLRLYDLRHSFATNLYATGTDARQVGALMGHGDGGFLSLKRYANSDDEAMDDAMDRLNAATAPKLSTEVLKMRASGE